jgi:Cu-Zn family superoxide dismutase
MLVGARESLRGWRALAVPMLASTLAACNTPSTPTATVSDDTLKITGFGYLAPGRSQAVVNLRSKSNSNVYGTITFREKDGKTSIAATVWNLSIGPHSIYIHENGNCSSPNAASAGPVWNVAPSGQKRSGQLPELQVGTEGNAYMQAMIAGVSIGDKKPTDIVGRSVVVHATVVEDPKPQFGGVPNGWIACGVIEQGGG